jgi:hypothetical protein
MAISAVEICNLALGHLGEGRIVQLEEDSAAARACQLHYGLTRDAVLRAHRWNFAQARSTLPRLEEAPAFGWAHAYQLPADCLRVRAFNDGEAGEVISAEFVIEGRTLLTDAEEARIVYTQRVTDEAKFDALFVEALGLALAVKLSETIRGTTAKTQEFEARYRSFVAPLARSVDANEGRRRKGLIAQNSPLVRSRGQGV